MRAQAPCGCWSLPMCLWSGPLAARQRDLQQRAPCMQRRPRMRAPREDPGRQRAHLGSKIMSGTVAWGRATTPRGKIGISLTTRLPDPPPSARTRTTAPRRAALRVAPAPRSCAAPVLRLLLDRKRP
jgi:hypothetical protein